MGPTPAPLLAAEKLGEGRARQHPQDEDGRVPVAHARHDELPSARQ